VRKTYTLEVDGNPLMAFRAEDMPHALEEAQRIEKHYIRPRQGEVKLSVRLATIPERAKWTAEAIEDIGDDGDEYGDFEDLAVHLIDDKEEDVT
jgi:hypothetical protein